MENKNIKPTLANDLDDSLAPLEIQQLEERLEVSSLVPGGHGQESSTGIIDIGGDNCCNNKCNGIPVPDDPLDTGEIGGFVND